MVLSGVIMTDAVKNEGAKLSNAGVVIGPELPQKGDNNVQLAFGSLGSGIGYKRNLGGNVSAGAYGFVGGLDGATALGTIDWQPLQKSVITDNPAGPFNLSTGVFGAAAVSQNGVRPILGLLAEGTHLNSGINIGVDVGIAPFGSIPSNYRRYPGYPYGDEFYAVLRGGMRF